MPDPLRLAVGTLTAVRVRPPGSIEPPVPGRAMALAPLVGLIPGLAGAIAAWLAIVLGLWSGLTAVIVIGVFALSTRGLHLDGLADTADGLAASYDRDKALSVMRRGDTGPTGLAAVVLVLLVQCAALTQVLDAASVRVAPATGVGAQVGAGAAARIVAVVVAVAIAARVAIAVACVRGVPAARPEGLGATVAGSVSSGSFAAAVLSAAGGCALIGLIGGFPWWAGALAVITVVVVTGLLVQRALRRFGGITGDVLGAAVELGAAAALLTLAAAG
jgi:adenosylcobinamide-GDP ribazoletransferase